MDHIDGQSDDGRELADLLAAAVEGDEAAWRELVRRYARRVYALAHSRCRSAELAEEVTQSVFATVAAKLSTGGYAEQGRFEPWLFRVAMNRVRDEVRRRRRRTVGEEGAALRAAAPEPAPDVDAGSLEALRRAIAELPGPDREVIELRHHAQMSFKQMAELLGEPVGTLLARHHRALRKLKALLAEPMRSAEVV